MRSEIVESARSIPVFDRADVLVVGGGPAGTAAAVSAARQGARVILLERYGFLGGLASGGQVSFLPKMDDGSGYPVGGIMAEWLERLAHHGGLFSPDLSEIGRDDPTSLAKWSPYIGMIRAGKVCRAASFDPELLKVVLTELVCEAGVVVYHHCWVCAAVKEDDRPIGVIFESKEGRRAILADRIIDATGDGDMLKFTDTPYEEEDDPRYRNSMVSEIFRMKDCDNLRYGIWRQENLKTYKTKMLELSELVGFSITVMNSDQNDVGWANNFIPGKQSLAIRDVSETESMVKRSIPVIIDFLHKHIPGYEHCRLLDIATFGVRHSRRLMGRHRITHDELLGGLIHPDTIYSTTCFSSGDRLSEAMQYHIPYGALVPQTTENLLVAGRCFSADLIAHSCLNLIPYCVMTGQAAGVAAALSISQDLQPGEIAAEDVRRVLHAQGVALPALS